MSPKCYYFISNININILGSNIDSFFYYPSSLTSFRLQIKIAFLSKPSSFDQKRKCKKHLSSTFLYLSVIDVSCLGIYAFA